MTYGGLCSSDTTVIDINALPIVSLGADATVCVNGDITLDAGNVISTFLWNMRAHTQTIFANTSVFGIGTFDFEEVEVIDITGEILTKEVYM